MNEVHQRRLVGAVAVVGLALLLSWWLPDPDADQVPPPGHTAATFDLTQPDIAHLPAAKAPEPAAPPAEPEAPVQPIQPIQTTALPPDEPDTVQPPESEAESQSFLAAKPKIVESPAHGDIPEPANPLPELVTAAAPKAANVAVAKPEKTPKPVVVTATAPVKPKPVETAKAVPPPPAKPSKPVVAAAKPVIQAAPPKTEPKKAVAENKSAKPGVAAAKPAATEKPKPQPTAAKPVVVSRWFVQVGSFTEVEGARKTQDQLKSQSYKSLISPADTPAGTRYRVRVGPYSDRDAALKAREGLAGKGYQPTVVEG